MVVTVAAVTPGPVYFTRCYLEDGIKMEPKVSLALLWMNVEDVLERETSRRAPEGVIPSRTEAEAACLHPVWVGEPPTHPPTHIPLADPASHLSIFGLSSSFSHTSSGQAVDKLPVIYVELHTPHRVTRWRDR